MLFKKHIGSLSNHRNPYTLTFCLSWSSAKSKNNKTKSTYINTHSHSSVWALGRFGLFIWPSCEFCPQCRDTESTFVPSFFPVQGFHSKQKGFYSSQGTQVLMIINHQAGRQLLFEQCHSLGTCLRMEPTLELNDQTCGYSKNKCRGGLHLRSFLQVMLVNICCYDISLVFLSFST